MHLIIYHYFFGNLIPGLHYNTLPLIPYLLKFLIGGKERGKESLSQKYYLCNFRQSLISFEPNCCLTLKQTCHD